MRLIPLPILILFLIVGYGSFAQDPTDALRYSFLTQDGGTARNQALGGAGGSLGGEFSTLFMNPAGLGFFKTGDFVLTPSLLSNSNESEYLGRHSLASNQKFGLSASGVLFATAHGNRKIKSVTTGFGINKTANFNNAIRYVGLNNSSSFSEKYVQQLDNDRVVSDNLAGTGYPYGASMGFNTFLINPNVDAEGYMDGTYFSLANPAYELKQRMDKQTTGGITDFSIGVGANHMDKFYFGGSINIPVLKYRREANYREDDMSNNTHNDFGFFEANEVLETKGIGANIKVGVIYKPQTRFQVGATFTTPTFLQLTDLYNMTIVTDAEGYQGQGVSQQSSTDLNDGNYLRNTYNMVTPLRAMVSGTYFFSTGELISQQKGFITADVEYVNYKQTSFKDANNSETYKSYFRELDHLIDNMYKSAINARIGGELKLNTVMARLGAAYYGNPYKDENTSYAKVTGGLGYRNRGIYIDLAYSYIIDNNNEYPYKLEGTNVAPARLSNRGHNMALTFGFKLY